MILLRALHHTDDGRLAVHEVSTQAQEPLLVRGGRHGGCIEKLAHKPLNDTGVVHGLGRVIIHVDNV